MHAPPAKPTTAIRRIALLGSTGSIGESTLRVVESLGGRIEIAALAVQRNYPEALRQAERFGVRHVAVADEDAARACRMSAPGGVTVHGGQAGLVRVASMESVDVVLCAVVGMAGLGPVMAALQAGKDVAIATKEVLVAAGGPVTAAAAATGARLLPVDSEHSAIFQCLGPDAASPGATRHIKRLMITASGGPFHGRKGVDFDRITPEEALSHPRWRMGPKISIDSATLMNKGLEVIEGHWLFGMPMERIDVVIHPESIVHSLVEFVDGNVLAQLSRPDMRFAIQYALTYPERVAVEMPVLELHKLGSLTFSEPDPERFPCLALAREAGVRGGTLPAVMNAANEVAVEKFLAREVTFSGIYKIVSSVMQSHDAMDGPTVDDIVAADCWAREQARSLAGRSSVSGS